MVNLAIDVTRAAEETRPAVSIEIYKQHAETLIDNRGRENYRMACEYLVDVRKLYERIGHSQIRTSYITALREQNKNLPALKDEMAKAKL